jgi:hypothetical protein
MAPEETVIISRPSDLADLEVKCNKTHVKENQSSNGPKIFLK